MTPLKISLRYFNSGDGYDEVGNKPIDSVKQKNSSLFDRRGPDGT